MNSRRHPFRLPVHGAVLVLLAALPALAAGGPIAGTVVDPAGRPIAGARVEIAAPAAPWREAAAVLGGEALPVIAVARSDGEGRFEVAAPAGLWRLTPDVELQLRAAGGSFGDAIATHRAARRPLARPRRRAGLRRRRRRPRGAGPAGAGDAGRRGGGRRARAGAGGDDRRRPGAPPRRRRRPLLVPGYAGSVESGRRLQLGRARLQHVPAGVWNVEVTADDGRVWTRPVTAVAGAATEVVVE